MHHTCIRIYNAHIHTTHIQAHTAHTTHACTHTHAHTHTHTHTITKAELTGEDPTGSSQLGCSGSELSVPHPPPPVPLEPGTVEMKRSILWEAKLHGGPGTKPPNNKSCFDRKSSAALGPEPQPILFCPGVIKARHHREVFCCFLFVCLGFFVFLPFLWATPTAYGGSQVRGLIRAAATDLHQSHSNVGSEPYLQPTPQLTATPHP